MIKVAQTRDKSHRRGTACPKSTLFFLFIWTWSVVIGKSLEAYSFVLWCCQITGIVQMKLPWASWVINGLTKEMRCLLNCCVVSRWQCLAIQHWDVPLNKIWSEHTGMFYEDVVAFVWNVFACVRVCLCVRACIIACGRDIMSVLGLSLLRHKGVYASACVSVCVCSCPRCSLRTAQPLWLAH